LFAEEPELHLHPSLHKRLANRIRAVSSQSIITTHSPLVAAAYKPSQSILMRNEGGNLIAEPLRKEAIKDIKSNAIRKLYLQKREAFYEAILGGAVLIPEGEYDYEWLRLLQRVVESSDEGSTGSLPLSVVPTQDGAVVETYLEVARFNSSVVPIVDGDPQGEMHLNRLCTLTPPPGNVVRLGAGAGIEFLAAWVLEPSLSNPGAALKNLLPTPAERNLKELQRTLVVETNKKDRELRENLASEALDNSMCVSRATEFLADISAIFAQTPVKGAGWNQSVRAESAYTSQVTSVKNKYGPAIFRWRRSGRG